MHGVAWRSKTARGWLCTCGRMKGPLRVRALCSRGVLSLSLSLCSGLRPVRRLEDGHSLGGGESACGQSALAHHQQWPPHQKYPPRRKLEGKHFLWRVLASKPRERHGRGIDVVRFVLTSERSVDRGAGGVLRGRFEVRLFGLIKP